MEGGFEVGGGGVALGEGFGGFDETLEFEEGFGLLFEVARSFWFKILGMARGLVRRQDRGDFHFVTFSCYDRKPYLRSAFGRDLFERSLETMRVRYEFVVAGYVVMPEHVHLLVSEPKKVVLGRALQALKLSVSVQSVQRPF